MSEELKQKDLAQRLGLTTRQIRNLEEQGLPVKADGTGKVYLWDLVRPWYIQFKQTEALERAAPKKPDSMKDAALRQAVADAEIAELKLANLRGAVVPLELHRKELRRILAPVRAALVGLPGRYASQVIGLGDMPTAVSRLRAIASEVLRELQKSAGEDPEEEAAEAGAA